MLSHSSLSSSLRRKEEAISKEMDTRRDEVCSERCSGSESTKFNSPYEDGKGVSLSHRQKKNLACQLHDSQTENLNGLPAINMGKRKERGWQSV
jgi:hypothetical protein